MNRLFSALFSICLLALAANAAAMDDMNQGAMMKKDAMGMEQGAMHDDKGMMKGDAMGKDKMKKKNEHKKKMSKEHMDNQVEQGNMQRMH